MDQGDSYTSRNARSVSAAATSEIVRLSADLGVPRSEIVRRIAPTDPQFSGTQFWRIETGKAAWTLDRFVFVAEALGVDPPMLLDRILRGYDILGLLRARDGPGGPDGAQPTSPSPRASGGPRPAAPDRSAVGPDVDPQ